MWFLASFISSVDKPNKLVTAVMLLTCMWEVPAASIGRGTYCFDTLFVVFSSLSKRAVVHLLIVKREINPLALEMDI
jgi:hypothetical protein